MSLLRVIFFLSVVFLAQAESAIITILFPEEIPLNISVEEFESLRPDAQKSLVTLIKRPDKASENDFEFVERTSNGLASYVYVFRGAALQAIIWSEPVHPDIPVSVNPKIIGDELDKDFLKISTKEIARANSSLEYFPVKAGLWGYRGNDERIFFVSTSEETTLIKFNSIEIDADIFFESSEKIPELQEGVNRIRKKTGSIEKETVPLVDRPWESLLVQGGSKARRPNFESVGNHFEEKQKSLKSKKSIVQTKRGRGNIITCLAVILLLATAVITIFLVKEKHER